ncbi:MAG: DNA repair ATPase [Phycisphaerae bacterium]
MAENKDNAKQGDQGVQLSGGTYEVIRNRLLSHGKELRSRLEQLNEARKDVFGSIETTLTGSERITTENNCVPRDMVPVGNRFLFGYNVFIGLRSTTNLEDVFAIYEFADHNFTEVGLEMLEDEKFRTDFQNLYKYYKGTRFAKFAVIGPHLFMVFRVGESVGDIKTFKWQINPDSTLTYVDNRSDHEYRFPPQHEFQWKRATRDMQRSGLHPHVSIEDRLFVETVGGDLTIKIEDNTETGEGIFSEPVDNPDQTLDDAEIYYAIVGNLILLRVRPYQEEENRYIVYSEKVRKAVRIDAIEDACVLLPDDHGLIFPKGYYLQSGEMKLFESDLEDLVFEKRVASPNGEDYLYIFYNRDSGTYVLLSYNLIDQQVDTPIICHGYSIFENGELIYFRADDQPQKHHVIQIWQTPYVGPDYTNPVQSESKLYQIGNKDIVRCMAECTEVLNLLRKEDTYGNLYLDIVRKSTDVLDSYFWIGNEEACNLREPLEEIRNAANSAVEEFEKVVRVRRATTKQIREVAAGVEEAVNRVKNATFANINEYVRSLTDLRTLRGEVISCKDLRYADVELVEQLEKQVAENTEKLSQQCVEFLLKPESLAPYEKRIAEQKQRIPDLTKAAEAEKLAEDVASAGDELDMLIDVVSNLKIEDATQTTEIIDRISSIYSQLNQVKSALKNKRQDLLGSEAVAEFNSQIKLIDQSVINYLDVCDTPEKCDEYLTKIMVSLEGLESKFAEFDEFIEQLTAKREEMYSAFESKKVQLTEARARRASALQSAADRMLRGIRNRAGSFDEITGINGFFASDLMVDRVREIVNQLRDLGDSVKADDVTSQLKTIQEDAVRQLKDRQALYEDGDNVIKLGNHRFSVNRQPLELTVVYRDGAMYFHLAGTGFFEKITDDRFNETKPVWHLESPSESKEVYRAEYLAFELLKCLRTGEPTSVDEFKALEHEQAVKVVQQFMGPRYAENYVKGVHDVDAAILLQGLLEREEQIDLLRYSTQARALACLAWDTCPDEDRKQLLAGKIGGFGHVSRLFKNRDSQQDYLAELRELIAAFAQATPDAPEERVDEAADYLFAELARGEAFVLSQIAEDLTREFLTFIKDNRFRSEFDDAVAKLEAQPLARFVLIRDWVFAYAEAELDASRREYVDEIAYRLFIGTDAERQVINASVEDELDGLVGSHEVIDDGTYHLNYCRFMTKLRRHASRVVPLYNQFVQVKKQLTEEFAEELKLSEFQPRVLSSFVRNKLIDKVYLPLTGDNLAKQMGVVGEGSRTDRMGMLLLISPPGYGKTTLMEYIANRLGLTFVKVNGPAIGHRVLSLDPAEAPNASAREELQKLNLSLEMGDNIMLYVDDIQHCNPEFLQKFISLCDATRKIEGVYKGRTRTYDLRGKKVAVVMAGNPFTESGERFQIPDMLANRADTYNLGDILGDNEEVFILSYIENCLTSNPVLNRLATRSQKDVYGIINIAETGTRDGVEFEHQYSAEEIDEYVSVMKKLLIVRDVVLKVNMEYIRSAGMEDQYRTEPAFQLQGSYRNMNRIAEKVLPVMNEQELWTTILAAYENDSQTLTSGAEANLLKFKQLIGRMSEQEEERYEDIKRKFQRAQSMMGVDSSDKLGMVIAQMGTVTDGLDSIRSAVSDGADKMAAGTGGTAESGNGQSEQMKLLMESLGEKLGQVLASQQDRRQPTQPQGADAESFKVLAETLAEKLNQQQSGAPQEQAIKTIAETVADRMAQAVAARDQQAVVQQAEMLEKILQSVKVRGEVTSRLPDDVVGKIDTLITQLSGKMDEVRESGVAVEKIPQTITTVLEEQFKTMQTWLTPVTKDREGKTDYVDDLIERFETMVRGYSHLADVLKSKKADIQVDEGFGEDEPEQSPPPRPKKNRKKS